MADSIWIRKYLQDRGFRNDDINYDQGTGTVTYQGKDLIKPASVTDGMSYASTQDLNNAINNYDQSQNRVKLNNVLDQYSQKITNQQASQPFKPTIQAPTVQPFQYSAESDPQYQAALRNAQRNAQTAGQNAQEELNARGILNSTVTSDRLGQIQQAEYGKVSDNILPQLMQQAYQRANDQYAKDYQKYLDQTNLEYKNYQDQYSQGQDQYKNLASLIPLISGVGQQALDNQYRDTAFTEQQRQNAEQIKQNNWNAYLQSVGITGNLGTGPKTDYSLLGGTNGAPSFQGQQYLDTKSQQGIDNARADRQLNATIGNMTSDNIRQNAAAARAAGNESQARLFDIWDRTGEAPAGIPDVPVGTKLNKGAPSGSKLNLDDYKSYINTKFNKDVPLDPRVPTAGTKKEFDADGARKYILSRDMTPTEIAQLLQLYDLPLTTQ